MLLKVYPEFEWQPWKFKKRSASLLEDEEVVKKAMKEVEVEMGVKEPSDWYRVSLGAIRDPDLARLFKGAKLSELLKVAYPKIEWDERRLQ